MSQTSIGVTPGAAPPDIEGLTYVRWLGGGGFADVFLYDQAAPARQVAVKVLRDPALSPTVVRAFQAEADAMARLEHPHIVPVFATGTTRDGRPYIVMMYYSKPSLAAQIRTSPLSVKATLRLGIQLGAAIETAHRAGILHRDIKPANVLTSAYGKPGLADFGIAGRIADRADRGIGISIPWAPPELLSRSSPASVQSDLYSLGATLWHALVGRSPHQIPGGDNSPGALVMRIRTSPAPGLDAQVAPADVDAVLQSLMAGEPASRPSSARALIAALQSVERRLGYPATVAELISEQWGHTTSTQEGVEADGDPMDASVTHLVTELVAPGSWANPLWPAPYRGDDTAAVADAQTVLGSATPAAAITAGVNGSPAMTPTRERRRTPLALVVAAATLLVGGLATAVALHLVGGVGGAPLVAAAPKGGSPSSPGPGPASPTPANTPTAATSPSVGPLSAPPALVPVPASSATAPAGATTTTSAPAPATTTSKTTTQATTTTTVVRAPASLTVAEGSRGNNSWCISSRCRSVVLTGKGFTPGSDYTITLHSSGGTCPAHGTSSAPSEGTADSSGRFTISGTSYFDCAGATVWATTVEGDATVSAAPIIWS